MSELASTRRSRGRHCACCAQEGTRHRLGGLPSRSTRFWMASLSPDAIVTNSSASAASATSNALSTSPACSRSSESRSHHCPRRLGCSPLPKSMRARSTASAYFFARSSTASPRWARPTRTHAPVNRPRQGGASRRRPRDASWRPEGNAQSSGSRSARRSAAHRARVAMRAEAAALGGPSRAASASLEAAAASRYRASWRRVAKTGRVAVTRPCAGGSSTTSAPPPPDFPACLWRGRSLASPSRGGRFQAHPPGGAGAPGARGRITNCSNPCSSLKKKRKRARSSVARAALESRTQSPRQATRRDIAASRPTAAMRFVQSLRLEAERDGGLAHAAPDDAARRSSGVAILRHSSSVRSLAERRSTRPDASSAAAAAWTLPTSTYRPLNVSTENQGPFLEKSRSKRALLSSAPPSPSMRASDDSRALSPSSRRCEYRVNAA